jgi:hypothetical protein
VILAFFVALPPSLYSPAAAGGPDQPWPQAGDPSAEPPSWPRQGWPTPQPTPYGPPTVGLIDIAPPGNLFILEVDNFEYTVSMLDRFLAGVSPIPMGLQMLTRAKLAEILGNPQLSGVNMNGTFGFVAAMPAVSLSNPPAPGAGPVEPNRPLDPNAIMFVAAAIPVTNFEDFITANPNMGQADAIGVFALKSEKPPKLIAKLAGNFVLISLDLHHDRLAAFADQMATLAANVQPSNMTGPPPELAGKPIRLYLDMQQVLTSILPRSLEQIQKAQAAMANMPGQQIQIPPAAVANLEALTKNVQLQLMTLGIKPSADLLNISVALAAIPGSKTAGLFSSTSPELQTSLASLQAKPPAEWGTDTSAFAALPNAKTAAFLGTLNMVDLLKLASTMAPAQFPAIDVQTKSKIVYAINPANGTLLLDVAVPKEHLTEVMTAAMAMQKQMAAGPQKTQPTTVEQPDTALTRETATGPSADAAPADLTTTAAPSAAGPGVTVVAARLVKFADVQRGIFPLGQKDGYTLSLMAELPAPAIAVAGGIIEKATTDTGKSLLPPQPWDRRIKLARLSKDRQAATFEIDLLVPDENARGLAELSGTIEYLTATGTQEVDLGSFDFQPGAKAAQLGAVVTLLQVDPFGKTPTVLGLTLDLPSEVLQSARFFDEAGTDVKLRPYGYTALGRSTTFKFSAPGELPKRGRAVLTIHDNIQKNELPFRIAGISLIGQSGF